MLEWKFLHLGCVCFLIKKFEVFSNHLYQLLMVMVMVMVMVVVMMIVLVFVIVMMVLVFVVVVVVIMVVVFVVVVVIVVVVVVVVFVFLWEEFHLFCDLPPKVNNRDLPPHLYLLQMEVHPNSEFHRQRRNLVLVIVEFVFLPFFL